MFEVIMTVSGNYNLPKGLERLSIFAFTLSSFLKEIYQSKNKKLENRIKCTFALCHLSEFLFTPEKK